MCSGRWITVAELCDSLQNKYQDNTVPCVTGTIEEQQLLQKDHEPRKLAQKVTFLPLLAGGEGRGNPVRFTDRTSAQPVWGLS
jgi:hypothetical protein